jgi:hypothetical protein
MRSSGSRHGLWLHSMASLAVAVLVLAALCAEASRAGRDESPRQQVLDRLDALQRLGGVVSRQGDPIVELSLSGRPVTDDVVEQVATLAEIRSLTLIDTRVTDAGIRAIARLPRLQSLVLDGVLMTDEGLSALASLEDLQWLKLSDTRVTEQGLEHLRGMKNLRELWLWDRAFGDRALTSLQGLAGLRRLWIEGDDLTENGLKQYMQAHPGVERLVRKCNVGEDNAERELAIRRIRRRGFTGRLRLAWGSVIGRPVTIDQDDPRAVRQQAVRELMAPGQARFNDDPYDPAMSR